MANWKKFTITDIKISPRDVDILDFYLNERIEHNEGDWGNYIPLIAQAPFLGWGVGGCIEIDLEQVKNQFSYGEVFGWDTVKGVNVVFSMQNAFDTIGKQKSYLQKERNRLEKERNEWKTKHEDCKEKYDKLFRDFRNLNNDKEDLEENLKQTEKKHVSEKLIWEAEKSETRTQNARTEENLRNTETRKTELEKELNDTKKDRDDQVGRLEIKLDQKVEMIKELNNQLTNLQIESNNKDNEIREKNDKLHQKDKEIEHLKKQVGRSEEELLTEKLRSERENLELFAVELGIDLEKVHNLNRYYERLFRARKTHNQVNITTHEDNIEGVKCELLKKKVNIIIIQEVCRKCEMITKLRFELDKFQQKETQISDWTSINPNFTLKLVQEWIRYSFTAEQCQDWIKISSPSQQDLAIKEPSYYAWLRDVKKVNAEWVLNQSNEQELGQEFFQWYQNQQQYQAQQEQSTNNNF